MPVGLEVCVDSVASARAALAGGAARLELCSSLVEGGTTPNIGLVRAIINCDLGLPLHVMVRPRGGDFLYSSDEIEVMNADIVALRALGVDGVVLGVLDESGHVNETLLRHFVQLSSPLQLTFHRAIDVSADPIASLRACLRCGVARVLSSGGAPCAERGLPLLRQMVEIASGQLIIAAAGGVTEANCEYIARASTVDELHGSMRTIRSSSMLWRPTPTIYMGVEKLNTPQSEYETREADPARILAAVVKLAMVPSPRIVHVPGRRLHIECKTVPWRCFRTIEQRVVFYGVLALAAMVIAGARLQKHSRSCSPGIMTLSSSFKGG